MADKGSKLPNDFVWGFATASYQIEGGADADGRLPSIWDTFAHTPGKVADGTNGDVACDSYNRWQEDVELLKQYKAKAYRLSISWSRVIPRGGRADELNEKGLAYYERLIDALIEAGIEPYITVFHWDLPQTLHDRYGGWLNKEEIVADFTNYAKILFERFSGKVKKWITFNEPWCIADLGYAKGDFAPGHKSETEPWIVGHNVLLAHASAVALFREKYQTQGSEIGITLNSTSFEPYEDTEDVRKAIEQGYAVHPGWFAGPVYHGDYPPPLKILVGDKLPSFTESEKQVLKGSSDFYGLNLYTGNLVKGSGGSDIFHGYAETTFVRKDGTQLGAKSHLSWLQNYPKAMRLHLNYLWKSYNTPILVTENGFPVPTESDLPLPAALADAPRTAYFAGMLDNLRAAALEDGVPVRGYFAWSLLDNFEWAEGYVPRFGVTYVDYATGKRTPKDSAKFITNWFTENVEN